MASPSAAIVKVVSFPAVPAVPAVPISAVPVTAVSVSAAPVHAVPAVPVPAVRVAPVPISVVSFPVVSVPAMPASALPGVVPPIAIADAKPLNISSADSAMPPLRSISYEELLYHKAITTRRGPKPRGEVMGLANAIAHDRIRNHKRSVRKVARDFSCNMSGKRLPSRTLLLSLPRLRARTHPSRPPILAGAIALFADVLGPLPIPPPPALTIGGDRTRAKQYACLIEQILSGEANARLAGLDRVPPSPLGSPPSTPELPSAMHVRSPVVYGSIGSGRLWLTGFGTVILMSGLLLDYAILGLFAICFLLVLVVSIVSRKRAEAK